MFNASDVLCLGLCQVYGSINEDQAMTLSPSPAVAAAAAVSDAVSRQAKPASSRWLRLRLYGSGGSGRRILPTALLGHRRRHTSSSFHCRDYSVDKLTDAVFHEFLRHDPLLDVRQSPLIPQSRASSESVDCLTAHRQGRPASGAWPLSAHIEENESDWLPGGSARRISPNSRSVAPRNTSDMTTIASRDNT